MNDKEQGINGKRNHNDLDEGDHDLSLSLNSNFHPHKRRLLPPPLEQISPPPAESISMQAVLAQTTPQITFQLHPNSPFLISQDHQKEQQHQYYSRSSVVPGSINPLPLAPPPVREPATRPARSRRNPTQSLREGKSEIIPTPFAWATDRRAKIHTLNNLLSRKIYKISGEVQCKRCEKQYEIEYDLRKKFVEVGGYIAENKSRMHDRAPINWMNPILPTCKFCEQENSAKPIISEKKKTINWLFLFLGELLGCCTLEQLRYFCKHTKNHRTGAKDRVLYLTYLNMCKQLDPFGPFDR